MSRKRALWSVIILTLAGSLVGFYGLNLILSDVSNMSYMPVTKDVISSLPIFLAGLEFELAVIGVIRIYRYPQYRRAEARLYNMLLTIFAVCGIASAVLTGTIVYHSFTVPYPFPGAVVIGMLWHILMLILAGWQFRRCKSWEAGEGKRHQSARHILYTVYLCVLIFLAFDRFGAVLWMPVYAYLPNLGVTIWFYLAQLLPLALLVHTCLHVFGFDIGHPYLGVCFSAIVIAADIVLGAVVMLVGMKDPLFISSVSPAVAIERLLTMPIDTILLFGLCLILALYSLYISLKHLPGKQQGKRSSG